MNKENEDGMGNNDVGQVVEECPLKPEYLFDCAIDEPPVFDCVVDFEDAPVIDFSIDAE